jgi:hypothetical protein
MAAGACCRGVREQGGPQGQPPQWHHAQPEAAAGPQRRQRTRGGGPLLYRDSVYMPQTCPKVCSLMHRTSQQIVGSKYLGDIIFWPSTSRRHHNVGLYQHRILTIQLRTTQLAYGRLPAPWLAQRHSNLSPAATFGALVAGQLLPGTMASAGPALRPAGQLLLENTRGKDSMFMLLRWNTLGM